MRPATRTKSLARRRAGGGVILDLVVWLLGAVGAFVAALLGVGGAIVMLPLLLYVPPALGVPALGIKTATALAATQVLCASVTAAIVHQRRGFVDGRLVLWVGPAMTAGSTVGAIGTTMLPNAVIMTVFAAAATIAGAMLAWPAGRFVDDASWHGEFSRLGACVIGAAAGLLVGLVGAGTFVLAPAFLHLLRVPTRVAIASSLAVAILAAASATFAKSAAGLIPLDLAAAIFLGTVPGALAGARVSHRLSPRVLRMLLTAILALVALRAWWAVLRGV